MAITKTKRINWLFPDPDTEVTEEDFERKIQEDEKSGDMSFTEFRKRIEQWRQENL